MNGAPPNKLLKLTAARSRNLPFSLSPVQVARARLSLVCSVPISGCGRSLTAVRWAGMEHGPCVVVQRFPYEEPYNTQLRIDASNGHYSGGIEIYCDVGRLRQIGLALARFPSKVPDEYVFEYGSEDPTKRWAYFLKFRAYTVGLRGQSALQFSMNLNREVPDDGRASFSIAPVEPAALIRLGNLFVRLESHDAGYFRWTPSDDEFRTDKDGDAA